jgi:hypothetical protein
VDNVYRVFAGFGFHHRDQMFRRCSRSTTVATPSMLFSSPVDVTHAFRTPTFPDSSRRYSAVDLPQFRCAPIGSRAISYQGLLDDCNVLPVYPHVGNRAPYKKIEGVFKKARPARPQPLRRAERTREYVSTAKRRERRWRPFSTLPTRFRHIG